MSERDERVEALAEVLHDEIGGCCVDRLPKCVFGGDAIRDEARRLLDSPAMRDLLAEAWDEGWDEGSDDTFGKGRSWNPYRQEAR